MIRRAVLAALGVALVACAAQTTAAAQQLRVETPEVHVKLRPADGFLYIAEYHLSTLEADSAAIAAQVAEIARLVGSRSYCPARYGFAEFTSMEERVYRDRGFITVECRLLSRGRNVRTLLADAFGRVLNRAVEVTVAPDDIGLHYHGPDVEVRGNNAKAVMAKDDQRVIFWRNGSPSYEAVFAPKDRPISTFRSLAPYFQADVASPEMSESQIEAWRRRGG